MPSTDLASHDPWRRSLRRSRSRRAAALRAGRRRLRSRGTILSLVALLTVGVVGADLATGHSGGDQAVTDLSTQYLSRGSEGPAVTTVQSAVGAVPDGVFGPQTESAVSSFQEQNGLLVDGVVGPQTLGALGLASAPAEAPSAPAPESSGGGGQQQPAQPEPPAEPEQPVEPEQPAESSGNGSNGSGDGQSAQPAQPSNEGASEAQSGGGTATPGVLQRIAECESGGNPTAVSADGQYGGKYQFDTGTWRSVGGSGNPADASEAEQDRRAQQLLEQQGTSPWAGCL